MRRRVISVTTVWPHGTKSNKRVLTLQHTYTDREGPICVTRLSEVAGIRPAAGLLAAADSGLPNVF